MKWTLGILMLVVLGLPLVAWVSAGLGLDRDRKHTRETQALPFLAADADQQADGLVQLRARGLVFRARVAGLGNSGPALLLLHGFPETSVMWDRLLERAARAGFRVVAFDQRGYSPGARPDSVSDYVLPELVEDARAVADRFGFERFHLVGHDWGSIVGWRLTSEEPERVLSWTSLSIPHPLAVAAAQENPQTPTYVRFFRQPPLPETLFLAFGQRFMRRALYRGIQSEHVEEYLRVFAEEGALGAAFNWYRALPGGLDRLPDEWGEIAQPVLYIWGNGDLPVFVGPRVQELHPDFIAGPLRSIELVAGHWLIQEKPSEVVDAIMTHLVAGRG